MSRAPRRGLAAEIGRFVRANLASTIASSFEYVLVTGMILGGFYYLVAATAGAVTGAVTDFSLKRHWAFDRAAKGAVHHEGLRYLAVALVSLLLNLAGSYALVDGLGMPAVPGIIAASLVIGWIWNYPLHRYWVFKTARLRPRGERRGTPAAPDALPNHRTPATGAPDEVAPKPAVEAVVGAGAGERA